MIVPPSSSTIPTSAVVSETVRVDVDPMGRSPMPLVSIGAGSDTSWTADVGQRLMRPAPWRQVVRYLFHRALDGSHTARIVHDIQMPARAGLETRVLILGIANLACHHRVDR